MDTAPLEQAQDDYFTLTDSIPQAGWYWAAMISIAASASLWLDGQTPLEHLCRPVATDVSAARPVPQRGIQVTPLSGGPPMYPMFISADQPFRRRDPCIASLRRRSS